LSADLAAAALDLARRFHAGATLWVISPQWEPHAHHVAVEFVHPVIVGKRALPALALTNDSATLSGLLTADNPSLSFVHQLKALGRPQDIIMGFSPDGNCTNVGTALVQAHQMGMLTLGLTGSDGGLMKLSQLDFCFVVPSHDPMAIQEIHETLYHVLWELVHVFFEHEGLLQ